MINNLIAKSYTDKKLAELLNPILEDLGFEMVRIRLSSGDPSTLQIMADRLNGQIGVDDLANINTSIGTILDVEDPIAENTHWRSPAPALIDPLQEKKILTITKGLKPS